MTEVQPAARHLGGLALLLAALPLAAVLLAAVLLAAVLLTAVLLEIGLGGAAFARPARAAEAASGPNEQAEPLGPSTLSLVRALPEGPDDPLLTARSRSVGFPDDGFLIDAATLPLSDEAFRVFPSYEERQLHHGTDELVAAIPRIAAAVRASYPDAVLAVGNLSGRFGGPIRYSRSHQSGRDVDLGFYAVDAVGNPALPDGLVRYRCNLRARDKEVPLRFDVPRNWALVAALLQDEAIDAKVVFVMPCLRHQLLEHAKAIGADPVVRDRAAAILRGPGRGSYAHDDHFHVRLYCTHDDLLLGCQDDGRRWSWTRMHEGVIEEERRALSVRLEAQDPAERLLALRAVASHDHKALARPVLRLLDDPDAEVRAAAYATTATLASPSALFRLRERLEDTRDPDEALAVLRTLKAFEAPSRQTAALLERIATSPGDALAVRLAPDQAVAARIAAVEALAFLGRRSTPHTLIRLIDAPPPELRAAAERSLAWLTNHDPNLADAATPDERRAAWSKWWDEARHRAGDSRLRDGFLAAGVEVPRSLFRWDAVRPLVEAVERGGALSWNAQQVLRRFARDAAPRIPHDRPEASAALWRAWLGSRLPAGALVPTALVPAAHVPSALIPSALIPSALIPTEGEGVHHAPKP